MTQQYLAGEVSLLLGQLTTLAPSGACSRDIAHLRREAETGPLCGLAVVAIRALEAADRLCWESLGRGDVAAFDHQACVGAELWQFSVCADLLAEETQEPHGGAAFRS